MIVLVVYMQLGLPFRLPILLFRSPIVGLQLMSPRSGMVESRIRTLVQDLENTDNVVIAHPQMGGIAASFICLTEEEQAAASQGELSLEAMKRKEEDYVGKEYRKVYTKNFFIGLEIEKRSSGSPSHLPRVRWTGWVYEADSRRGWSRESGTQPLLPEQTILCCLPVVGKVR